MNKWIKLFLVIIIFAAISTAIYFILKSFGITNISTLQSLILQSGKFAPVVYSIILTIVLISLCFIPLLNAALTLLGIALLGSKVAFISNIIAIFFSTSILFFIGDMFAKKIIGEKDFNETQNLLDLKSKLWLPVLFIIPIVPDEAICLVAGMTKIKYWYLLLVSLVYHTIEIGFLCFLGSSIINWAALTTFDWLIVANLAIIDIFLLKKLEKYLEKKIKNK